MSEHDDDWFDHLYATHVDSIYRYLARRAASHDAEDLAAEVFTVAWRRRHDVPDGEMELAWLYRTAKHLLANYRRKFVATPVGDLPDLPELGGPEASAVEKDQVRAALAQLSPRDREILTLAAWEGMNGRELAAVLGISRGGADAALSRARSHLERAFSAGRDERASGLATQTGQGETKPVADLDVDDARTRKEGR